MHGKGEDGKFVVMVDGREEFVFRSIDNADVDDGLTSEELNFVGAEATQTVEGNGPVRITFTIKPDSPGLGRLIALRRERAKPQATRSNVRFDMTLSVDFGDGGRERWAYPDMKLTDGSRNVPGRNQHITGKITAICDNPRQI